MEFNPLSDDFFDDPYETYRWLRDEAPCYRNDQFGFFALSRFDDVVTAHRDWRTFSSEHGLTLDQLTDPNANVKGQSIIMMDPPDHDRMRKLVSRAFTPRAITRMEPIAQGVIDKYLDLVQGAGEFGRRHRLRRPVPGRGDLARSSAFPRPIVSRSGTGPTRCCSAGPTTRAPPPRACTRGSPRSSTSSSSSRTSARTPTTT